MRSTDAVPFSNFTSSGLRAWAVYCEAQANDPHRLQDREELLRMRDSLLAIAEVKESLWADGTPAPLTGKRTQAPPSADDHPVHSGSDVTLARQWADNCRSFSYQCLMLARRARSDHVRLTSLNMAKRWLALGLNFELSSLTDRTSDAPGNLESALARQRPREFFLNGEDRRERKS
jgi:hypothetical protein